MMLPRPSRLHRRQHRLDHEELRPQIHCDRSIPVLLRHVLNFVPLIVGRIVHQHIDAAKNGSRLFDGRLKRANIRQVAANVDRRRNDLPLQRIDQLSSNFILHIEKHHPRSLPRKMRHDRSANPAGPAGNQHRTPGKARIARILRTRRRIRFSHSILL